MTSDQRNRGMNVFSSRARKMLLVLLTMVLSQFPANAAPSSTMASTDAKLTEAHGSVYKRDFIDWTRESLAVPEPASVGDVLHEGMQLGTRQKSWAQICWKHLTTRAWENSIYAIAPNQRLVYLVSGEMLYQLDKNRKDKSAYFVWTNLLQARIRGTTVLFQATKNVSRITVLEGTVEVLNKVDKSTVTLKPGVVYEIATNDGVTTSSTTSLTNVTSAASPMVPIFSTSKTRASISAVDPMSVLNHPLIRDFDTPLASLPSVQDAMTNVQSLLDVAGDHVGGAVTGLLHDTFEIMSAPKTLSYSLGADVRAVANVAPGAFDFFSPVGVVGPVTGATPIQVGPMVPSNTVLPNLLGTTVGSFTLQQPGPNAASSSASSIATTTATTGSKTVNDTANNSVNTAIGAVTTLLGH